MPAEKEKAIAEIKKLKKHLPKEKQEDLTKILAFGEKYKKEGKKMRDEFREKYDKQNFLKLIYQYEDSKESFLSSLPTIEKEIINSLEGIKKDKFYKEYLNEIILYRGNPEKVIIDDNFNNCIPFPREKNQIIKEIKKLRGKLKPCTKIDLSYGEYGEDLAKTLAKEWKDSLQPCMNIDLKNNKIGDTGIKALAKNWKKNLKPGMDIDLSRNGIGDEGVKTLAKERKESLQPGMEIDLSINVFGDKGIKIIAKERKNSLKPGITISIMCNKIGANGIKTLAEEWNDSLQPGMSIRLSTNNMGDDGVQAIMDNLKLKEGILLDLRDNNITGPKKTELIAWVKSYKQKGIECHVLV